MWGWRGVEAANQNRVRLEQRPKGGEGASLVNTRRKNIPGGWACAWCLGREQGGECGRRKEARRRVGRRK